MMQKIFVLINFILGIRASLWMLFEQGKHSKSWALAGGIFSMTVLISAIGLLRKQKWAFWMSLVHAAIFFALGLLFEYLVWDFRCFLGCEKLPELLLEFFDPRTSAFIIFPIFWVAYCARPHIRVQFK